MATTIKATKTLTNGGQCFTKGETYIVNAVVHNQHELMKHKTINDLGQIHNIGNWYKHFKIV